MSWLGWRGCGGSHKIAGCLLRLTRLLRLLLLLQGLSLLLQLNLHRGFLRGMHKALRTSNQSNGPNDIHYHRADYLLCNRVTVRHQNLQCRLSSGRLFNHQPGERHSQGG